jgi:hypothetical protein
LNLSSNSHKNELLQNSFNNSSRIDFEVITFILHDREDAYDLEQFLLNYFSENPNLANKARNSRLSALGSKLSEKVKEKLAAANKGKKHSAEHIAKRVEKIKGRNPHSSDFIEKFREWSKNRIVSEETRQKLSLAFKGRRPSEETLRKKRETSERTKCHMVGLSKAHQLKRIPVCINGQKFESIKEAALALNIDSKTLKYRLDVSKLPGYEYHKETK